MSFFISPDGSYHEGDPLTGSEAVPRRPSQHHAWDGAKWALDLPALKSTALGEVKQAAVGRINDLDNDVDKPAVRTALVPFKADFQAAATGKQVATVKARALAAIEAL